MSQLACARAAERRPFSDGGVMPLAARSSRVGVGDLPRFGWSRCMLWTSAWRWAGFSRGGEPSQPVTRRRPALRLDARLCVRGGGWGGVGRSGARGSAAERAGGSGPRGGRRLRGRAGRRGAAPSAGPSTGPSPGGGRPSSNSSASLLAAPSWRFAPRAGVRSRGSDSADPQLVSRSATSLSGRPAEVLIEGKTGHQWGRTVDILTHGRRQLFSSVAFPAFPLSTGVDLNPGWAARTRRKGTKREEEGERGKRRMKRRKMEKKAKRGERKKRQKKESQERSVENPFQPSGLGAACPGARVAAFASPWATASASTPCCCR